jgi:hypothetical protein
MGAGAWAKDLGSIGAHLDLLSLLVDGHGTVGIFVVHRITIFTFAVYRPHGDRTLRKAL